ncbi:probable cytochrome P450 9f2 [Condylostylus longicornis]|uniref:probable cytochrome P450 9f2 n=1 Tax=Condylostylus longicornis TaxID=2530218 RepID=UPI00244DF406|nr:probable cytochrome P450 9f2 [Condylostylus longicornis]
MSWVIEAFLFVVLVLFLIYKYITLKYDYFDVRDIPYEKPFLCFGNFKSLLFKTEAMFYTIRRLHEKFKDEKVYGIFEVRNPIISIRDPDLIKQITVKDFDHFVNHRQILSEHDDPLFGNSLFNMLDSKWKDMRSTLTPAFTGNKMRVMFEFVKECCEDSVNYLKKESLKNNPNEIELEMKDFFTRFTNDVIATSAFGIKVNSLNDKENEFYRMGRKITNFTGWVMLKFFLFSNFKAAMRFLRMKLFDPEQSEYFRRLVIDAMKYREVNGIIRPDMINMLMEARKNPEKSHNREWNDDEIVAQCFIFFLAGFETSSNAMCFAAHELMENRDIQEKLIEEIDDVREQLNGESISYETLNKMKYLDMVVSETLRKWPGALATDRVCVKPYVLKYDDRKLELDINDVCWVNISGLHYDPENFPDPEKFDPERFSDENKSNIKPYTYLPFGVGPRNCIGNRFALMECKAALYYLLSEFTFDVGKKTSIPLILDEVGFQLKPKKGFWLKLTPRQKISI